MWVERDTWQDAKKLDTKEHVVAGGGQMRNTGRHSSHIPCRGNVTGQGRAGFRAVYDHD